MKRHMTFVPATAALLVILLSACGGGGPNSPPPAMDTGIGPEGGEVVSDDGQLTLTIPEGALADRTDIVIIELTGDDIPDELQNSAVRKVYDLQPDGLEFALPATVEVRTMGSLTPLDESCENPTHVALFEDMEGLKAAVICFTSNSFQVFGFN